jgi:predicted MPP superfamily phosphohydrolase
MYVGDLQRTSLLEFWRESNDAERPVIISAIADVHPSLVAFTGDCVFDGSSDGKWFDFDALVAPLRDAGVPAVIAFGNHEYWGGRASGEAHVFARFPYLASRHWYSLAWGPVRVVVLDSNEGELGEGEQRVEREWYARVLDELDADESVRGVIVMLHHPPYTNSTVTGDEAQVQRDFVPAFARAKKTLAMMTGHVHSYERFLFDGKTYVVSGGGGGPRARLLIGPDRRHANDAFEGPALRDFNFVVLSIDDAGLAAEVRGLPKGAKGVASVYTMDRFVLPFAR